MPKVYVDTENLSREELEQLLIDKEKENEKLREFKAKQEEMMFLIWASIELAEPKTYRDAEKLQKGKEIYEKLYKEELYSLRKENELLKECNIRNYTSRSNTDDMNLKLLEENKKLKEKYEKLKADYIKLSKIVEISWGYRASYVNELRDKIAKLEQELKIWMLTAKDYARLQWVDLEDSLRL